MSASRLYDERGQSTVEYVGIALLVALLFGAIVAMTPIGTGAARIGKAVADRLVCAVRGDGACAMPTDALSEAYGFGIAALIEANAPEIRFEDADYVSLPVDPRRCRQRRCADTSRRGDLRTSFAGQQPAALVRVVDCRPEGERPEGADCTGGRNGNVYLQYWLYYPDSATRAYHRAGYHVDD